jgi:uncharacterized protein with PIN domain
MDIHPIRFAADGMLQSLGTWLRLMGYDTIMRADLDGRHLLEQAVAEDRIFLTRNAHLEFSLPKHLLEHGAIMFVVAEHLPDQLREVAHEFDLDPDTEAFTRCLLCNTPLVRPRQRPSNLPNRVADRETEFWQCPGCLKIYWRGSHVTNSLARLKAWLTAPADSPE